MSLRTITCPHCGFSKQLDASRIPAATTSIKCPKCQKSFALEPGDEETFSIEAAPAAAASGVSGGEGASRFCPTCGHPLHPRAEICPGCGVRVSPPRHAVNKVALLLLTFFVGGFGGHKFYLKKYLQGVFYLLFFWTWIPSLIALVELIIYLTKSEEELQRRYPEVGGAGIVLAIVLPLVGIAFIGILAAIAIPQFAAYRQRAYDAAARADLQACRVLAEAWYADNQAYPTERDQLLCQASKGVALYYLAISEEEYQLISFHGATEKAFLSSSVDGSVNENSRTEIERQISERFGTEALGAQFHFIE